MWKYLPACARRMCCLLSLTQQGRSKLERKETSDTLDPRTVSFLTTVHNNKVLFSSLSPGSKSVHGLCTRSSQRQKYQHTHTYTHSPWEHSQPFKIGCVCEREEGEPKSFLLPWEPGVWWTGHWTVDVAAGDCYPHWPIVFPGGVCVWVEICCFFRTVHSVSWLSQ